MDFGPYHNILVGGDPEVFLFKGNKPKSSQGLLGGSKEHPRQIKDLPKGFMILEDNVTAEFNFPPAKNLQTFKENVTAGLGAVKATAREHKLKVGIIPALHFPPEELTSKGAQILGCDPDFCVWTMQQNESPVPPPSLRTAAGHVHIGWDEPSLEQRVNVGRLFDVHLTLPSILATDQNERRQLYGRAGAVRFKPYGIECRTLDNFWIRNQKSIGKVYQGVMNIFMSLVGAPVLTLELLADYGESIVEAINAHDKDMAEEILKQFETITFLSEGA